MANCQTAGKRVWAQLEENLALSQHGPWEPSRKLVKGVTSSGTFVTGMTADLALKATDDILVDSQRLYVLTDSIVMESGEQDQRQLKTLAVNREAEPGATSHLSNVFVVSWLTDSGPKQALPPTNLVKAVLASDALATKLPHISTYVRRPVFDASFSLCGPGWHQEQGILVHGPACSPLPPDQVLTTQPRLLDRLPPHLKALLGEFCFKADADLANAVALFLTGLLINHFIDAPHPSCILDGNQPGLGKTLLVQALGRVLDGSEPVRIPLTNDEEIEKKLCTQLLRNDSSLIFFDNMRSKIESAFLEQNLLSPMVSCRILGTNKAVSRPNTFLWVFTSNMTAATSDFINRCMPIRLFHEGDTRARAFASDPLDYAQRHRLAILGELAGLVGQWNQCGRPMGQASHRCSKWSRIVGGILTANGLGEAFLTNLKEAEDAMDEGQTALLAVAEKVQGDRTTGFGTWGGENEPTGKATKDWLRIFESAQALDGQLTGLSPKSQETRLGSFLSSKVGRVVECSDPERPWKAMLRKKVGRSKISLYWLEYEFEAGPAPPDAGSSTTARPGDPPCPTPLPPVPGAVQGGGSDSPLLDAAAEDLMWT